MSRRLLLGTAALFLFVVLATANSGGYRYGVSDQAFYLPAIARSLDPALFPRDSSLLAPQRRAWLGDDLIAAFSRATHTPVPALALAGYVLGLVALAGAAVFLARGLGASSWTTIAALALLTLRHRIPRTGANSLEGYFHPRVIAFALGLWALGFVLRRRPIAAVLVAVLAGVAHPTTALWFGIAVVIAAAWQVDRRALWAIAAILAAVTAWLTMAAVRMDATWLSVVADKDYLFPMAWPAYAWAVNLAYPIVLWAIYRRRVAFGAAVPGEGGLIAGLIALAIVFLISVPLTALNVALAVQLQVTRVFWVLDAVALVYVAWWIVQDFGGGRSYLWRPIVAAMLVTASAARGSYVLGVDTGRPLASWTLQAGEWNEAMDYLRSQPAGLHVLADPGHALKYGTSVRVAALQDTVLEQSKDTAMAIYDRDLAVRVADRITALSGFEDMTGGQLQVIGSRFDADVLVFETTRRFDFPVLFENTRFVVYALR